MFEHEPTGQVAGDLSFAEVLTVLRDYIAESVLRDASTDLDGETPLLEWGILNSLEIVRLIAFIDSRFGVEIDHADLVGETFRDLNSISALVLSTNAS